MNKARRVTSKQVVCDLIIRADLVERHHAVRAPFAGNPEAAFLIGGNPLRIQTLRYVGTVGYRMVHAVGINQAGKSAPAKRRAVRYETFRSERRLPGFDHRRPMPCEAFIFA